MSSIAHVWRRKVALLLLASFAGCATLDKVEHPNLSAQLASEIERDLNTVNQDEALRIKFRGFLTIGPYSFEKYQYGEQGPRLIVSPDSVQNINFHSVCFNHPVSAMTGSAAGRTTLAFELFRHRLSDPVRPKLEALGAQLSTFENDDAICFRMTLENAKGFLSTIPAHLASFSDLDLERGKQALRSALEKLSRPAPSIYEILALHADGIRYSSVDGGTRYGIPQLTKKVSLLQRNREKEFTEVRDSYYPGHLVSVIVTSFSRSTILNQFRNTMRDRLEESHGLTQTSSSALANLNNALNSGANSRDPVASKKRLPRIKGLEEDFLLLSWTLPTQYHEDYIPLQIASKLLAQRWTMSKRLEIHTQVRRFGGRFDLLTEVPKTKTATHALAHVRQLISDISSHSQVDKEIKRIKNALKVKFWNQQANPIAMLSQIERYELIHGDFEHLHDAEKNLSSVDRNQVVRVLSEYLLLQTPIMVEMAGDSRQKE